MRVGVACSAGAFKGVFSHGVLEAFSEKGFRADIYAASSSIAMATAFAAAGDLRALNGSEHWQRIYSSYLASELEISSAIAKTMPAYTRALQEKLFLPSASRFAVVVSAVITPEAQALTQGEGARRLGQRLVLATRSKDNSWAKRNLECRLFESGSPDARYKLTSDNLYDALYASTRMLHAWKVPAWIDGFPYVDASYTCVCPALELADMGCSEVIALSSETGTLYRDFFQSQEIPSRYGRCTIHLVRPPRNLAEIGVDFMKASESGLLAAYELGRREGLAFLEGSNKNASFSPLPQS